MTRSALLLAVAVVIGVAVLTTVLALDDADSPRLIAQPNLDTLYARIRSRLAPASQRVDLSARGPLADAALALGTAGLDLQLRYRPRRAVDRSRFELWTRRVLADASAGSDDAVRGDVATLGWIRDRVGGPGA